jgi:hypothetical protein
MTTKELIVALGGNARVAAHLGIRPNAISDWFRRETIPARHQMALWRMARAASISWTPPEAPAEADQVAA